MLIAVSHSLVNCTCGDWGVGEAGVCLYCVFKNEERKKKRYGALSLGVHREQATSVKFKAINLVLAPWRL